jgi:hypothetical protein
MSELPVASFEMILSRQDFQFSHGVKFYVEMKSDENGMH